MPRKKPSSSTIRVVKGGPGGLSHIWHGSNPPSCWYSDRHWQISCQTHRRQTDRPYPLGNLDLTLLPVPWWCNMCVCLCAQGLWPSSMSQPAPGTRTGGPQVTTSPQPQDTESPCLSLKGPAPCPGKHNPSGSPGVTLTPIPAAAKSFLFLAWLCLGAASCPSLPTMVHL